MTVRCPNCGTDYLLAERLLGPRGARVRCPACARAFVVTRAESEPPREGPDAGREQPQTGSEEPREVARELLDSLAERLGRSLEEARVQGRTLAAFGPELMGAYQRYRARLGRHGDPRVFREALRERWGVDLVPPP